MGRAFIRSWTLLNKELAEVFRQPMLVVGLVLGPFVILVVFAVGHREQQPPLRAVLDLPTTINLTRDLGFWHDRFGGAVTIDSITSDEVAARTAVERNQADLAIIIAADTLTALSSNKQATIRVLHNQINPIDQAYTGFVTYILAAEINKQLITEAARQAQLNVAKSHQPLADLRRDLTNDPNVPVDRLNRIKSDLDQLDQLSRNLEAIAPGLIAAPFAGQVESISPVNSGYIAFYSPGVLALLLQHLAISFAALSLVRDRFVGLIELYKVAPTSTIAILFGKYASYSALCLGVAGALTYLMVRFLAVPFLGDPVFYWGTLALLVFASLGVGLTISLLSASEENAVQLTMLVLLASVFFSGFFLPVNTLQTPATEVSAALPVSHGIVALQELMLRGSLSNTQPLVDLGIIGLIFFVTSTHLLNRELRRS